MLLPTDLQGWLEYQQRQHPQSIAMGLERVREVAACMGLGKPAPLVLTVAGTNGKGSTVALLSALLASSGLSVGSYTSPHLLDYRERVRIAGVPVAEESLLRAFEQIEQARGAIPLTFFEYGTLAALQIFAQRKLDAVVLEVGLGGRLDAVNLVDADGVVLTTVELDHQDYLGSTREAIGLEKAGVFRPGQFAVYADRAPLPEVLEAARHRGTQLLLPGVDYRFQVPADKHWSWQWRDELPLQLPLLALQGPRQVDNAAAALALLRALSERIAFDPRKLSAVLARVQVPGRLQLLARAPEIWIDVAHNPQAAQSLAEFLIEHPRAGRTLAVYGGLGDKDVLGVVRALRGLVRHWFLTGLDELSPRGLSAAALYERVASELGAPHSEHRQVAEALATAQRVAQPSDRIVVFGSFYLIAAALAALGMRELPDEARLY